MSFCDAFKDVLYERDPSAKEKCKDYYMKLDGRITC